MRPTLDHGQRQPQFAAIERCDMFGIDPSVSFEQMLNIIGETGIDADQLVEKFEGGARSETVPLLDQWKDSNLVPFSPDTR